MLVAGKWADVPRLLAGRCSTLEVIRCAPSKRADAPRGADGIGPVHAKAGRGRFCGRSKRTTDAFYLFRTTQRKPRWLVDVSTASAWRAAGHNGGSSSARR